MARNKGAGLAEIGAEGFDTLEDTFRNNPGRQPAARQDHQRQPQYGNRSQQPYMNNRRNSNHNNSVPPKQEGVIDCNEAAKMYGGVLFKESGGRKKKKSFWGFSFF